ncbi:pentapeptide repeat protein [Amycolatopsis sulphurea]|jgi:uncharacterized protein YjbI with pentapeptide repeats|uniref:Pentapeptide repeat protein n=2 Tax=Amycolatopsis sulphurea TaxID=76022 RepID=A0A2A9FGY7_9PSEU|nr:pentapeptide repeat protein [Amycolatopsis sulphurea]
MISACAADGTSEEYGLVAADDAVLAVVDIAEFVAEEIAAGRVFRTAAELPNLRTLVLTRLDPIDLWVVDGWALIREQGVELDLSGACLRGATLTGARLSDTDLAEADLRGADLEKADLSRARLVGANLSGSILYRAGLAGADLTEADLRRTDLRHADLRDATCTHTAFRGADLWDAYMWDVDLSTAFTEGTDITRAAKFLR